MILQTEIVGRPQSGKTAALVALYRAFESQGLRPVFVLPTCQKANEFYKLHGLRTIPAGRVDSCVDSKVFLLDGDIQLFRSPTVLISKIRCRLAVHRGVRAIVTTRTGETSAHQVGSAARPDWKCNVLNCGAGKCVHTVTNNPCPECGFPLVAVEGTGVEFCTNHTSDCYFERLQQQA